MLLVETAFIPEYATSPHLEMVVLDMSYPRIGLTSHPGVSGFPCLAGIVDKQGVPYVSTKRACHPE